MAFRPDQILFSPTTRCNLTCPHCDNLAIFLKSSTILPERTAIRFLALSAKAGIKRVGFTGGEPFLAGRFLLSVVKAARREGLTFDRIMTNGVWYKSEGELMERLTVLHDAGYDGGLSVSVDAFHKQDLAKVARFINAAVRIWGRKDIVSIASVFGPKEDLTVKKLRDLSRLLKARLIYRHSHSYIGSDEIFAKILRIDLSAVGKARRLKNPWDGRWFKEDNCRGPGNVFLVLPSGDVKPCCGYASEDSYLTIGNINRDSPKRLIRNAAKNRFVSAIFDSGLGSIRRRLARLGVKFPGRTSNNCYFCHHILTEIPKDILKKSLLNAIAALALAAAVFNLNAFASAQEMALEKSKDYTRLTVKALRRIKLPRWYHEGLFYDGSNIWTANGKNGNIWIVDLPSGGITSTIQPAGTFTEAITKGPRDTLFVSDWDQKRIYSARVEKDKMVTESEISLAPAHPAGLVWNGKSFFVVSWERGFLTKFYLLEMDEHFNLIRKVSIKDIPEPAHLAWDGHYLWVTSWYNKRVYKIDVKGWRIKRSFRSSVPLTTGIVWDGRHFWITGTYADLYQLELKGD